VYFGTSLFKRANGQVDFEKERGDHSGIGMFVLPGETKYGKTKIERRPGWA